MISLGRRSLGAQRRRALDVGEGAPYFKSEWMETGTDPLLSPIVFLIEQPPGSVIPTHFHRQNEFQVVIEGSGAIGRHALEPVSVHYAGAYSGYGPVSAGPQGLAYFTLRPAFDDAGAITMERARAELVRGPKRQSYARPFPPAADAHLAACRDGLREQLLPAEAPDLSVERLELPPGMSMTAAGAGDGCGVFHLVVAGAVRHQGELLQRWETLFASADEEPVILQAQEGGAEVISMRMPQTAVEYRRSRA